MHSILIIGQSNMGGRGFANEVEPIVNDKLFVLRNGLWRPMYIPVNPDRITSGVNLAESFADLYAKEHNVDVGIIPCADGGTCLDQWAEGEILFDHACYMAELASRTSTITAVLWHQGESDSSEERYPFYEEKLTAIFDAFRKRLGLDNVPFIVGGLGDFLVKNPDPDRCEHFKYYYKINESLQNIANNDNRIGFASAKGLSANPDYLHFSAKDLREFGERYYQAFLEIDREEVQDTIAFDATPLNEIENL